MSPAALQAETIPSVDCSMRLSKRHKAQTGREGRAVDQVFKVDSPAIEVGKIPGEVGAGIEDSGPGQKAGEACGGLHGVNVQEDGSCFSRMAAVTGRQRKEVASLGVADAAAPWRSVPDHSKWRWRARAEEWRV